MLTLSGAERITEKVKNTNIELIRVRTGIGLLYHSSRARGVYYMGLEGHNEVQSKEAMQDINISYGPPQKHRHKISDKTHSIFHDSDLYHYEWEVSMLAPLYFQVKNTKYNGIVNPEFILILPRLITTVEDMRPHGSFDLKLKHGKTYLNFPFYPISPGTPVDISNQQQTEYYKVICQESINVLYLFCDTDNIFMR